MSLLMMCSSRRLGLGEDVDAGVDHHAAPFIRRDVGKEFAIHDAHQTHNLPAH